MDRKFGVENHARDALAANPKAGFRCALAPNSHNCPYHHGGAKKEKKVDYLSIFAPTRRAQIHPRQTSKASPPIFRQSSNEKSTAIKARWVTLTESERALELV